MRNCIILLASVLFVASCGKGSSPSDAPSSDVSTSSSPSSSETFVQPKIEGNPQSDEYVIARVEAIYDNIFKENFQELGEDDEGDLPQDVPSPDEKFCTKDWNELVSKVIEYDNTTKPDEQGFFEFDYWVMGQDYGKLSISDVRVLKRDKDDAEVELLLHNLGSTTRVRLELEFERGEWFIDNIIDVDEDYDLKEEMEAYLDD
ncbi:MAG: DUF3828 domain-containing protein [Prevotella sp.]|nr:DUF3828 domain-containing protein [Prevotella sp.]